MVENVITLYAFKQRYIIYLCNKLTALTSVDPHGALQFHTLGVGAITRPDRVIGWYGYRHTGIWSLILG